MKKFLKKTNRGIILSAICLVILVIYVSVDYITFSTQKDTIRQTTENYINDVLKTNSESVDLNKHRELITDILNNYWTDKHYSSSGSTISGMKATLDSTLDADNSLFDIKDASGSVQSIKISKAGPKIASANIKYTVDIVGKETSTVFTPGTICTLSDYNNDYYDDGSEDSQDSNNASTNDYYKVNCTCEGTIYYTYESGKWKISTWDSYVTDSNCTKLDDKED